MREDVRDILERAVGGFEPGDGFDQTRRKLRRRHRARRMVAGGTALAVAAAGGVFAWRAFIGAERRVHPASSPLFVESVPLPDWPLAVSASSDALWAVIEGEGGGPPSLVALDPGSGEVLTEIGLEGTRTPFRLEAAPDAVWILDSEAERLLRVDPIEERVVAQIAMPELPFEVAPGDHRFVPSMLAVTSDRVWVGTARGAVAVINPQSNEIESVRKVGIPPLDGMEQTASAVWVHGPDSFTRLQSPTGDATTETIYQRDPADPKDQLTHLVATDERAWAHFLDSGLREVWPTEGSARIEIPRALGPLVSVGGLIYAVAYDSETGEDVELHRIATDPLRFVGDPIPLPAVGPATTDGETLWLADYEGSRLIRVSPRQQSRPAPTPDPRCDPSHLQAIALPSGFKIDPRPGPAGSVPAGSWPGEAVHYQGPDPGTHITVTIIEEPDRIPQGHGDAQPIRMLGAYGTIGSIEDGYSVEWVHSYPPNGEPCAAGLWIAGYGVSEVELRGFAEGLTLSGAAENEPPCPLPAVRPTYLPPGFSKEANSGPGSWDPKYQVGDLKPPTSAIHFQGPGGGFIEVARYPKGSFHFFLEEVHRSIRVLGEPADLGSSTFGALVTFQYGADSCNRYSIISPQNGVTERELARFAEGLQPA